MKLDRDGNGSIDRDEFFQIQQIANNPLATRLMAIFDEDGGGTVDFQEFVGTLSAFSSKGNREDKLQCEELCHFSCLGHCSHFTLQSHSKSTTWTARGLSLMVNCSSC